MEKERLVLFCLETIPDSSSLLALFSLDELDKIKHDTIQSNYFYDGTLFVGFNDNRMPVVCKQENREDLDASQSRKSCDHPWSRPDGYRCPCPWTGHPFWISLKRGMRRSFCFALDTQTPEDIDFIRVEQVADDFHSRYRSTARPMNLSWIMVVPRTP